MALLKNFNVINGINSFNGGINTYNGNGFKRDFRWEWKSDQGIWVPYHDDIQSLIEKLQPNNMVTLLIGGWNYEVTRTNAGKGYQLNTKTQKRRSIRRTVLNVNKGYPDISALEFKWQFRDAQGAWKFVPKKINALLQKCNVGGEFTVFGSSTKIKKTSDDDAMEYSNGSNTSKVFRKIVYAPNSQQRVIWQYKDDNKSQFIIDSCDATMKLTKAKANDVITYTFNKWTYHVIKNADGKSAIQTNTTTMTRRPLKMMLNLCSNGGKLKRHNNNSNNKKSISDKKQDILKLFGKTMNLNQYKDITVKPIRANKQQKSVYKAVTKNKNSNNERMLFHGTSKATIDKIIENGFNRDFCVRQKYGKGVYFAKNASKANGYCQNETDGYRYMLVCRVFVGDYTIGNAKMTTPPLKNNGKSHYDSLVNRLNDPTIFVISKDYHAIPEYTIKFK